MAWWLDIVKVVSPKAADALRDGVTAMRSAHAVRRHRYIIGAIGPAHCLMKSESTAGAVSLDTIDRRVALDQRHSSEEASKCGIPDVDDPHRRDKLKQILHEMEAAGKLRYHRDGTWSIV
jgi:hypothetical protein